jgi:hypothetical protein
MVCRAMRLRVVPRCYNVPIGLEKPEEHDPMHLKTQWIRSKYDSKEYLKKRQVPGMPDANVCILQVHHVFLDKYIMYSSF